MEIKTPLAIAPVLACSRGFRRFFLISHNAISHKSELCEFATRKAFLKSTRSGGLFYGFNYGCGRGIGVLMLLQMAAGLILSFVLMDAVRKGYPSFLETAAASGTTPVLLDHRSVTSPRLLSVVKGCREGNAAF